MAYLEVGVFSAEFAVDSASIFLSPRLWLSWFVGFSD